MNSFMSSSINFHVLVDDVEDCKINRMSKQSLCKIHLKAAEKKHRWHLQALNKKIEHKPSLSTITDKIRTKTIPLK